MHIASAQMHLMAYQISFLHLPFPFPIHAEGQGSGEVAYQVPGELTRWVDIWAHMI